jgi:hypothetical protein
LEIAVNMVTTVGIVPPPVHSAKEFLAYETECRSALKPLLDNLIDMAESAGWSRRATASTLMFLAAQHLSGSSAAPADSGS